MKKNWKTQCLAGVLAGAMTVMGLPTITANAEVNKPALLADFSFNEQAVDGVYQGGSAKATTNGACQLAAKTGEDSTLYLNGAAFLNVTAANGDALLKGKEEITVSYDAKVTKSGGSWSFYAAPDTTAPIYKEEQYLGVLHTTSEVTVQRFNNTTDRPGNDVTFKPSASAGSEWMHVDIVYAKAYTQVYVNGESKGKTTEKIYNIKDILGTTGGIVQIGKANWVSGEYFQGSLDNYRIYDGVLSDAAIQEQYQEFQTSMDALTAWENRSELQKDYDDLEILNQDDVRGNLALIRKGRYGSTIEWTSTEPSVVSATADDGSLYCGGVVTRPAAGSEAVDVTLTAKLSYPGKGDMTKTFDVKVQPKEADLDTDYSAGYLWTNFGVEDGYEKIFFGYSEDGLTWKKLNKTDGLVKSILANDTVGGDLAVRDPHLIRSAEGDRYWILGTDLHAEGTEPTSYENGSHNIVVWESNDLVNWSEPRLVYSGFEKANCVWAPEAIYDETTGDYVVYWSIRDKAKMNTEENALRVYVCRTRDFKTFSESKVWLSEDQDTGGAVNIIDTTIVKGTDNRYYRFSTSDWNTVIDVSDTLDTEDVLDVRVDATTSKPNGSWKRIVTRTGSGDAGFTGIEGLTVYQLPDETWCAMGDNQGYNAFVTDDMSSGEWTATTSKFVDGRFRHGTVVRLSKAEQARILEKYGEKISEGNGEERAEEPVLMYDFENESASSKTITDKAVGNETKEDGKLYGNAKVVYDEAKQSNVLQLDGSSGTYAEIPQGFFDKRNYMTISMDVKAEKYDGDVFTFTYGKNNQVYNFLRIKDTTVRNAITVNSYGSGNEKEVTATGVASGKWQKVVIVADGVSMRLYLDGRLVSENENTGLLTASLGTDLLSYFGKSFYPKDNYFKGSFDNFKVYNRVLSADEIDDEFFEGVKDNLDEYDLLHNVTIGTIPEKPSETMGTDDHTAAVSTIDSENHEITSYVMRGTDLTAVPVTLELLTKNVSVTVGGKPYTGGTMDLSETVELKLTCQNKTETYTIKKPKIANNPVLPGQYADPDIDYFDGKYWIFPTTDGYPGWSGTKFHAWSSENLLDWTDEGIIMELANNNPGVNDKGVQIAKSPWAKGGSAWAPTIEEKDGKYYFYYCGKYTSGTSAIGVAVADDPAGPYTDKGTALISMEDCTKEGINMGQAIDPSIFKDTDGKYYMTFGNGDPAIVELNDDMISYKSGTMKNLTGLTDFRESVVITEKDGTYHFTWSCDDANSPNYHVNYGTSDKLYGPVTYKYTLLQKDTDGDMLGTAHQSVVYNPDTEKYYIAYHRFYTPLGIYTSGLGVHRTTCIEELTFDETTGLMNPVKPTMEGVESGKLLEEDINSADFENTIFENGSIDLTETTLPTELDNGTTISWKSTDGVIVAGNDKIRPPKVDTAVELTAIYTLGNSVVKKTYLVTVKGTGFTVKYIAGAGGSIEGMAEQKVFNGRDAESVKAVADDGYHFVKWSDDKTDATRTDTNVTADIEVTAEFAQDEVTVKYIAGTGGKINGKAEQTVTKGEDAEVVTAVADTGYRFVKWSDGVTTERRTDKKLTSDLTVTAQFEQITPSGGGSETPGGSDNSTATKVSLNIKKLTLGVGETYKAKATVEPNTASAAAKKVTWSSSSKNVKVNKNSGKIQAKKKGSATITVTTGDGATATCKITVKPAPTKKTKISVSKKITIKAKKSTTLKPKVKGNFGCNTFKFTSKSKKIAKVDKNGKVTGVKRGNTKITVTTYNKKAKATVSVTVK